MDGRKMARIAWEKLCKSKVEGGMGFRNLEAFNLALLAKQAWRLMNGSNSIFFRVFKAKYFPSGSIMTARLSSNPSYVWRSIWAGISVRRRGVRWRIGDGKGTTLVGDPWIPIPKSIKPISPQEFEWK